jgi:hypothetical protein
MGFLGQLFAVEMLMSYYSCDDRSIYREMALDGTDCPFVDARVRQISLPTSRRDQLRMERCSLQL